MGADLQLQLLDSGGATTTFDVGGRFGFEVTPEHQAAGNPPPLARHVERWTITGARITGAGVADLWTNLKAFLASLEDRTGTPIVSARMVRDPSGAAVVERLLGASVYQRFMVEDVQVSPDPLPELEAGSFRTVAAIDLVVSAERPFADGDDVLTFDQQVSIQGRDGLQTVTYTTIVETAEGTDAETVARSLCAVPISEYGETYTWVTNVADGVEIERLDADERSTARGSSANSSRRTPTRVRATSAIQQNGITIGSNTAGNSPNDPSYSVETDTEGGVTTTTYRASARGPGARTWVEGKAPGGPYSREVILEDTCRRICEGTWVKSQSTTDSLLEIAITITGGYKAIDWGRRTGNRRPRPRIGSYEEFRLEVQLRATFTGKDAKRKDLPFPALLPEPFYLDRGASKQDLFPRKLDPSSDPDSQKWERGASLVYTCSEPPDLSQLQTRLLDQKAAVEGYWL